MSICEFSVNTKNKCGTCKYFRKYDETGIFGECINDNSKARNKTYRSEKSKDCAWKETK